MGYEVDGTQLLSYLKTNNSIENTSDKAESNWYPCSLGKYLAASIVCNMKIDFDLQKYNFQLQKKAKKVNLKYLLGIQSTIA